MTNLMWYLGAPQGVSQTKDEVRNTTETVRQDGPAEQKDAPDWNELETDQTGQVTGPTPSRVLASHTEDKVQSAPFWAGLATAEHNEIIDKQVATSGTAAAREMAGAFGHGTMQYAEGIEPVIRDGAAFGADYFTAHDMGANQSSGEYMTPVSNDHFAQSLAAYTAERNSREAYQSTLYDGFLSAMKGN